MLYFTLFLHLMLLLLNFHTSFWVDYAFVIALFYQCPLLIVQEVPPRGHQHERPPDHRGGCIPDQDPFQMGLSIDDDPSAVNSLHVEIQNLQARIMSRLRESPPRPDTVS